MTYFIWSLQKWVKNFPGHPVQHRNTHFSYWTFARYVIFRENWRACWSFLVRTQSANINVITRSNIESMITWDFNPKRTDFPLNSYSNLKTAVKITDIQISSLIKEFTWIGAVVFKANFADAVTSTFSGKCRDAGEMENWFNLKGSLDGPQLLHCKLLTYNTSLNSFLF